MRTFATTCAIALVLVAAVAASGPRQSSSAILGASSSTCNTSNAVGYRLVPFKGGRLAALWYPSSSAQARYSYSKDISTTLAYEGTPLTSCGRFPLVVFAHGLLGCGGQSVFFTETLARFGYVVVAPDYRDALLCHLSAPNGRMGVVKEPSIFRPQDWTPATYADRMTDTKDLISMMLRDRQFGPLIDTHRIGIVGHSLGGYTALGMVGGWPAWRDSRIKVALLMSPYSLPFSVRGTLGGVKVPLMYQGADGDIGITPFLQGPNGAYTHSNAPKYFVRLYGGNHFTWTNAICAGHPNVRDCLSTVTSAQLIDEYGIAFLQKYLKDIDNPLLTGSGTELSAYQFAN